MQVIELRNYLLEAGRTADFLRYFEEHFLVSQRAEGMHVLGQFAVVDQPDRFVWIRGFADMKTRLRGLEGFYGGPFWLAHRDAANAMMREHHNVHLLRPLSPLAAPTEDRWLERRWAETAGALPPESGLIVVDFLRTAPETLPRLVDAFERRVKPALVERGHRVLGHFVAELAPNDYPRLPVIQDPNLLVVLSAYPNPEGGGRVPADRGLGALGQDWPVPLRPELTSLLLRPTARSLIRHADGT
jgi:hypothetical protein